MRYSAFLGLPLVLLAQAPQPVPQDPAKARLEGQVLNAVTNERLRKARLTLRMNAAATQAQRQPEPLLIYHHRRHRYGFLQTAIYDPDFLGPYESNAQTVEVLPGGKKAIDLKLTLNKEP
jgi:hypothetical protein